MKRRKLIKKKVVKHHITRSTQLHSYAFVGYISLAMGIAGMLFFANVIFQTIRPTNVLGRQTVNQENIPPR